MTAPPKQHQPKPGHGTDRCAKVAALSSVRCVWHKCVHCLAVLPPLPFHGFRDLAAAAAAGLETVRTVRSTEIHFPLACLLEFSNGSVVTLTVGGLMALNNFHLMLAVSWWTYTALTMT